MRDDWAKASARIAAPRGEVMSALVDAERFPVWWSAGWSGCWIEGCVIEARAGGSFRVDSRTKRGKEHYARGRFLHVAPELLYFTWDADQFANAGSAVLIGMVEVGTETEVTIEHRGLEVDVERERARLMWRDFLAVLARGVRRVSKAGIAAEIARFTRGSSGGGGGPCP